MYKIGISSSCYYPELTEDSFKKVCECGAVTAELFFNSYSELSPSFIGELKTIKDSCGVDIVSVHPFGSFTESFYLFSNYERRFFDSLPLYDRFFEAAAELGAKIFVVHGSKLIGSVDDERYFELFGRLMERAKSFGVIFAQENVVNYRGESPERLCRMKKYLGSEFKTVLDIKQARRAGVDVYDFLDKLSDTVCHVHLSDYNDASDCVPPGEGKFDFARFFTYMKKIGYNGAYIEELYRHSYTDEIQVKKGWEYLVMEAEKLKIEN